MATLLEQSVKLKRLDEKTVINEIFRALESAKDLVLSANKGQLSDNINRDGTPFEKYKDSTEMHWRYKDPPRSGMFDYKVTTNRYNFDWSGDFLKGLNLTIDGEEAVISSTGMDGGKEALVNSTDALGLTDENLKKIIQSKILPELNSFARKTLNI